VCVCVLKLGLVLQKEMSAFTVASRGMNSKAPRLAAKLCAAPCPACLRI
jgi:hypothetical protein